MGVPQPKTFEAYEFLKSYNGLTSPNNFRFLSWLKSAEQLVKTDAPNAYTLKSFAYILMGKPKEGLLALQNAERLGSGVAKINLMNVLLNMGDFEQSSKIALDNLIKNPQDDYSIQMLMFNGLCLLDTNKINNSLNIYQGTSKEVLKVSKQFDREIHYRKNALAELNISETTFINILKFIYRFLSHNYAGKIDLGISHGYTEIGGHIHIGVFLKNLAIDKCLLLQDKFLDELVESDLDYSEYKNILVNFMPETECV